MADRKLATSEEEYLNAQTGDRKLAASEAEYAAIVAPDRISTEAPNPGQPLAQGTSAMNAELARLPGGLLNLSRDAINFAIPGKKNDITMDYTQAIQGGLKRLGVMQDVKPIEERTPAEHRMIIGGETLGTGLTGAVGGAGLAAKGLGVIGKAKGPITRGVKDALTTLNQAYVRGPGKFLSAEVAAASGAAQGAVIADAVAPGNSGARLAGEVIGSFVSPLGLAANAAGNAVGTARTVRNAATAPGRQKTAAAKIMQALVIDSGEDPAQVAELLRRVELEGPGLTVGAKTGSTAMRRLEASIAKENTKAAAVFDNDRNAAVAGALGSVRSQIDALAQSGDPAAVSLAADLRARYFKDLVTQRVDTAMTNAMTAADNFKGVADTGTSSRSAAEYLQGTVNELREVEKDLWSRANKSTVIDPVNLADAYEGRLNILLDEDSLPAPVNAAIKRILKQENADPDDISEVLGPANAEPEATVGEALRLRSRLRALARREFSATEGDRQKGLVLNNIADGLDQDLIDTGLPEILEASAFTRSLYDNVYTTLAGKFVTRGSGAPDVPPDLLFDRVFSGSPARRQEAMSQLLKAENVETARSLDSVRQSADEFLRSNVEQLIDETGAVSQPRLDAFLRQNREVIGNFPGLQRDLGDLQSATAALKGAFARRETVDKITNGQSVFARVLKTNNPYKAVSSVMTGGNPQREFNQLASVARRHDKQFGTNAAQKGLATTVIDYARNKVTNAKGEIDYVAFERVLKDPIATNQPSVSNMLARSGGMSPKELTRFEGLVNRAADIQRNSSSKFRGAELLPPTAPLMDFIIRFSGARAAASIPGSPGGGSSLIVAGAGSQAMRRLMEKIPQTRVMDILIEAAQDPKLAADLLARPTDLRHSLEINSRVDAKVSLLFNLATPPDEEDIGYDVTD